LQKNLLILGDELKQNGISFITGRFEFAGYDSPMHFWNRHNEVWVEVIEEPEVEESKVQEPKVEEP